MHDEYTCLLCAEIENYIGEHVHHEIDASSVEYLVQENVSDIAGKISVLIPLSCILDRDALILKLSGDKYKKEFNGPTQTTTLTLISVNYSQDNALEVTFRYRIQTYMPNLTGGTTALTIVTQTKQG